MIFQNCATTPKLRFPLPSERFTQLFQMAPADCRLLPATESDARRVLGHVRHLPHVIWVDDDLPVNPQEDLRIEQSTQLCECCVSGSELSFVSHNAHQAAINPQQSDPVHRQDQNAVLRAHGKALKIRLRAANDGLQQRVQLRGAHLARGEFLTSFVERLFQPPPARRLEQVVNGVRFKGRHRILIVSSDEDDQRQRLCFDHPQRLKPVQSRHPHVEKEQIRLVLLDLDHRVGATVSFSDNFDVSEWRQHSAQPFTGQLLVIHNQRMNHKVTNGMANETVAPFPGLRSTRKPDWGPYKADNLSLMLLRPTPRLKSCGRGPSGRPDPVSAIAIFKCPSLTAAESVICPPSGRLPIPCLTAFSTRGWTVSAGILTFRASGATTLLN